MSIRHPLSFALALLPCLASSLVAVGAGGEPQVAVEARIVEVQVEPLADLGVAFNPVDSQYRSTGAQAPADTHSTGTSGSGGGGLNLMAILFPDGDGLLGAGPTAVGVGAPRPRGSTASRASDSSADCHGTSPRRAARDDVIANALGALEWAVDLTATARSIRHRRRSARGSGRQDRARVAASVGATFTHVETSLRSDQTILWTRGSPREQLEDTDRRRRAVSGSRGRDPD